MKWSQAVFSEDKPCYGSCELTALPEAGPEEEPDDTL